MISDEELRKLIPALPNRDYFDPQEDDVANAHALATARAVWAAAIEDAAKVAEETVRSNSITEHGTPIAQFRWHNPRQIAAAIRELGK